MQAHTRVKKGEYLNISVSLTHPNNCQLYYDNDKVQPDEEGSDELHYEVKIGRRTLYISIPYELAAQIVWNRLVAQ
jgi:hypothetical protein